MTRVTTSTRQFSKRQAIRQMAADMRAQRNAAPPPMRVASAFEKPLSPEEAEVGVRDGTFIAPADSLSREELQERVRNEPRRWE
jgi:hypothetical protein